MTKITFPPSFDHTSNSSNRALVCKQRIWLNIVKQNMIAYLLHILNTNSYPKLEVSVWDNISRTHCWDNANFLKLLLLKDEHLPLLNVQAASLPNIFTDFLRPSICHHLPSMLAVLQSEKPQNRSIFHTAKACWIEITPTFQESYKIWLLSLEQQDESWFLRRRIFLETYKIWSRTCTPSIC